MGFSRLKMYAIMPLRSLPENVRLFDLERTDVFLKMSVRLLRYVRSFFPGLFLGFLRNLLYLWALI